MSNDNLTQLILKSARSRNPNIRRIASDYLLTDSVSPDTIRACEDDNSLRPEQRKLTDKIFELIGDLDGPTS